MNADFLHTTLGRTGSSVHRMGLSASYWPGKAAIHRAIDCGINYFFGFGLDLQMMSVMRDVLQRDRKRFVVATGAYNYIWAHQDLRRTLEKRLRQLRTDYIDVFLFLGVMKEPEFPAPLREELCRLRDEGKIRAVGLSTHNRQFAGRLAADGEVDVLMIRYNAAHRGAEEDIFPHLKAHDTGLVSYTATRWTYLLRRPRGWPRDGRVPDAGLCYRFVLSNPNVNVCMTAPSNMKQLEEDLRAAEQGPLSDEDMQFMRQFGDTVHHTKKWFM
jgi:aryl-alcohol dehydrogenase-like predicted oxidoreductase